MPPCVPMCQALRIQPCVCSMMHLLLPLSLSLIHCIWLQTWPAKRMCSCPMGALRTGAEASWLCSGSTISCLPRPICVPIWKQPCWASWACPHLCQSQEPHTSHPVARSIQLANFLAWLCLRKEKLGSQHVSGVFLSPNPALCQKCLSFD